MELERSVPRAGFFSVFLQALETEDVTDVSADANFSDTYISDVVVGSGMDSDSGIESRRLVRPRRLLSLVGMGLERV